MGTSQALPEEVQVEEHIVLPAEAGFQGQEHQGSEDIRGAADVDDWEEGSERKASCGGDSPEREAGAPGGSDRDLAVVKWDSWLSTGCGRRQVEKVGGGGGREKGAEVGGVGKGEVKSRGGQAGRRGRPAGEGTGQELVCGSNGRRRWRKEQGCWEETENEREKRDGN